MIGFQTEGGTNINVAIAKQILARLKPDHELLVIEMGAYRGWGDRQNLRDGQTRHRDLDGG